MAAGDLSHMIEAAMAESGRLGLVLAEAKDAAQAGDLPIAHALIIAATDTLGRLSAAVATLNAPRPSVYGGTF